MNRQAFLKRVTGLDWTFKALKTDPDWAWMPNWVDRAWTTMDGRHIALTLSIENHALSLRAYNRIANATVLDERIQGIEEFEQGWTHYEAVKRGFQEAPRSVINAPQVRLDYQVALQTFWLNGHHFGSYLIYGDKVLVVTLLDSDTFSPYADNVFHEWSQDVDCTAWQPAHKNDYYWDKQRQEMAHQILKEKYG
jgi:hypothetical protein